MKVFQWTMIGAVALALAANGQDPLRVLPANYQLAFENDFVRVVRVHYGAHEKLPVHDHPKTPTAYVYLSDAGPVRFNHTWPEAFGTERPGVRKGGFRLNSGVIETHVVENISDSSSDFLRVEFKTMPLGSNSVAGRYAPPENPNESGTKVEFEDANLRIVRAVCGAQSKCELDAPPNPVLEIVFSPGSVRGLEEGQVRWVPEGSINVIENAGTTPAHVLRIEFKKKTEQ